MFKRWSRKIAKTYISTVLAASLFLSAFPLGLPGSPFLRTTKEVQAASVDDSYTLEKTITGSDGKEYHFTATFSSMSGIPSDADLSVNEIIEGKEFDGYLEEVNSALEETEAEKVHLFDITIMKDGNECQPNDGYPVSMKIELEETKAEELTVVHFSDEPGIGEAEIVENTTLPGENDSTIVEFSAESFSVYAIVEHEGEEVVTPRFTIHYLSPVTDLSTQETVSGENYIYTVPAYEFLNKAGSKQTTQIIKDGETLEMIVNPPNRPNEFFYGWYVVDCTSVTGSEYSFQWTSSPKHLPFGVPVSVTDNGDGSFTMTWMNNGQTYSETAQIDPTDYSAHIYVAPIYEDYCFVNFHELAYAVSNTSNLLTRKLIILGSDGTERVLVSDVSALSTDTIRKIFRGWQYRANNTWISVQTVDDNTNTITKYIDVTGDVDLYPYFQEGRWLYFNVGDSGNGAQYVPAQFTLAEFNSEGGNASIGGVVTQLPTTSRVGYEFGGWRVITDNSDPDNPVYMRVTDENGNFLPGVDLVMNGTYTDNDGNTLTGVAYTIQNGELTIKYPLSSLTFYAQWDEKANAQVTVVVWKQKVTDDPNATVDERDYDYYILPSSIASVITSRSGVTADQLNLATYRALTTNNSTKADFTGFHLRTENPVVMSDTVVRGDGSTVVNVYYDRNVHTLSFQVQQSNRWNTVREITALYEQNISSYFPIVGTNGVTYDQGERWQPQNSSTYNQVLVYIDIMPDESITFRLNTSTNSAKDLYYYVEPLPGTPVSSTDRTYNGKRFVLYHHTVARYGFFTEAEDYLPLIGFYKDDAYPVQAFNSSGNPVTTAWGNNTGATEIYCYYLRNASKLAFEYNYPVAAGMEEKRVVREGIPYDSPLDRYDYTAHPDDLVNAVRPIGSEIPEHYVFGGWYEDAACTEPFDFNSTMPAADKIIYGKWTPIYYTISIDPNGGIIDHINYTEPTDSNNPTFYLDGFTSANASDPRWIAAWNANGDAIGSTPSWVNVLAASGNGHNTSHSTYFTTEYGTAIGQYELERTYVEYEGTDDGTKYYYVNMQHDDISGEWGLHADMRNALYLTMDQLQAYYKYLKAAQAWHEANNPGYYDGAVPSTFEAFMSRYVNSDRNGDYILYEEVPNGQYAFVGWYKVNPDGSLSDTPYNFTNAVEDDITLQAVWRRVGSYYISYDPSSELTMDDGSEVLVNGQILAWTDPVNAREKYNDGAITTTLQQPTGITVNGVDAGEDIIFLGWQVVEITGYDTDGKPVYSPLHDEYYAEPTLFTIHAEDADANGCIHMHAVYQTVNSSIRRPNVANLVLDANDGHLTDGSGNALVGNSDITSTSGWTGAAKVVEDAAENEIVFGNMQSNNAVHVYKYAVTPGMLDVPYNISTNYFKHDLGYLLIGFDEGSDYSLEGTPGDSSDDILTGDPFVPTYAADSVISVQRTDNVRLYAVWEPMVYVSFTNRTTQPVTFDISGSGNTMSIVNEATGAFGRERYTETSVTLAAGETIKFVMPKGGGETFTITGTNTNTSQLLNITSYFQNQQTGQTTAGLYRSSGADFDLSDTLQIDAEGVHVYFDGVDTIFYDVNGGTWTDTPRTGSSYAAVSESSSLVYVDEDGLTYEPVDLTNGNTEKATKPTDPTRSGYTFIGWTTSKEVTECDPAAYTLPGTSQADGINNMAVIKQNHLWNFDTDVHSGMTLYAVWGQNVTVTFHLYNTSQTWRDSDAEYYVPGSNNTYVVTMSRGDILRIPDMPTWDTTRRFYRWVDVNSHQSDAKTISQITGVYDFGTPVMQDMHLYTSWINADHIDVTLTKTVANGDGTPLTAAQMEKEFTFTVEYTTQTYTGSVSRQRSGLIGYTWPTTVSGPVTDTESQTFVLKHGDSITIPLYFDAEEAVTINSNTTKTVTLFFQSMRIVEVSDPDYTVSISVNGQNSVVTNSGSVTTMAAEPTVSNWTTPNTGSSRTYTLRGTASYANGTNVPVAYTNTRTNTDVAVTKIVTPDDYITGDEEFFFTAEYGQYDSANPVQFSLKNGETMILRGVPIGGSITVKETAPGWNVTSDATKTGDATFTIASVPSEGGSITVTNTRNTYDVEVSNQVLPDEYGDKTMAFTYTATLWDGDTKVNFPSSITDATFSNGRKNMTFMLKDDESFVIRDIPGGYKLIVTQIADDEYVTTVGEGNETKVEALTYTITDLESDKYIGYVNTLKTGSYTVTKNVQLAANQTLPPGTLFPFTAKLLQSANSSTPMPISSDIEAMITSLGGSVSGNVINFSLADGGSITLSGLPVGYFLQVQENAPGYAAYVSGIRTDYVTVQITETANSDINYINRLASAHLDIQKVDKENGNPIQGASFRLYNLQNGIQNTLFTLLSGADGFLAYTESGQTQTVMSLENGTYYLVETSPAGGYVKLSDTIVITVDNTRAENERISISQSGDATLTFDSVEGKFTLVVENTPMQAPAPTGTSFRTAPLFMVLFTGAALFLATGRKKRRDD